MSYIADEVKEPIKMQGVLKHENYSIEANFGMQGSLVVDNEGKIRSSKLLCLHRENYMIFDKIEILIMGKSKSNCKYYTGNGDLYQERNLTFDYYDFSKPECKIGDCVNGSGEYYYGNGKSYIGTFKNGKRHGYGILSEGLNYDYSGEWVNDKKHGYGTERDESSNFAIFVGCRAGFWENNEYCCREP
ncbi:MAG: hypothetical protein IPN86_21140 [Saprospiraceae bacterium]|nr:hypothetical protein [Saprospiraceae bacterium]